MIYVEEKKLFIKNNFDIFAGFGKFADLYEIQLKDNAVHKPAPYRRIPHTVVDRFIIKLKELLEKDIVSYVDQPID